MQTSVGVPPRVHHVVLAKSGLEQIRLASSKRVHEVAIKEIPKIAATIGQYSSFSVPIVNTNAATIAITNPTVNCSMDLVLFTMNHLLDIYSSAVTFYWT